MPYILGEDPRADGRWLYLLNWSTVLPEFRRDVFAPGVTLAQLMAGEGLPSNIPLQLQQQLQRGLLAAAPVYISNGVDATLPIQLLTLADRDYPPLLRQCTDAPAGLFVVGDATRLSSLSIAVVGSRKPSIDGRRAATEFSSALSQAGLTVVSGLALGVDGAAHEGALNGRASTVAVMATGIDAVYPLRHRHLARAIAHRGAVVTEFLPGATPQRRHFHRRNRTISGLALGTVVVEAGRPSGSLITATAAAQQGREVFALPWSVYHGGGAGCRALLADGAHLALSPEDIIVELGPSLTGQLALLADAEDQGQGAGSKGGSKKSLKTHQAVLPTVMSACKPSQHDRPAIPTHNALADNLVSDAESAILRQMGDGEHSVDAIAAALCWPVTDTRIHLGQLELAGHIERTAAGYRQTS